MFRVTACTRHDAQGANNQDKKNSGEKCVFIERRLSFFFCSRHPDIIGILNKKNTKIQTGSIIRMEISILQTETIHSKLKKNYHETSMTFQVVHENENGANP